jgi:23S rRNA pseudouridine2605 synthase
LQVSRLIRTRFGKVELPPRLMRGKMVELDAAQVKSVLASAGMKVEGPVAALPSREARSEGKPDARREGRVDGREARGPGKLRGPRGRGAPREARPPRDGNLPPAVDEAGNPLPRERVADGLPFVANDGGVPINKRRRNKRGARGRDVGENRGPGKEFVPVAAANFAAAGDETGVGGNSAAPAAASNAPAAGGNPERIGGRGRTRRNLRGRSRGGAPKISGADGEGSGNRGGGDDAGNRGNGGGNSIPDSGGGGDDFGNV